MSVAVAAAYLRNHLRTLADNYYNHSDDAVSDAEYDAMLDVLKALESTDPDLSTADSPTNVVGADPIGNKVFHTRRVLSLRAVKRRIEALAFVTKFPGQGFTVEEKIDGMTAIATYENGILTRVATRGNGLVGTDITDKIGAIANLPTVIYYTGHLIVQGEVFIHHGEFRKLVTKRKQLFKSSRAATSSVLMNYNDGYPNLAFAAFDIIDSEICFLRRVEVLNILGLFGFKVVKFSIVDSDPQAVDKAIDTMNWRRKQSRHATDGVVIKLDSIDFCKEVGETKTAPNWAIALKELAIDDPFRSKGD